jgi:hypothetical protein
VKQGVHHGSVLSLLLFIIYINDLPMSVKHVSKAILFADDTSVVVTDSDYNSFKQNLNIISLQATCAVCTSGMIGLCCGQP